MNELANIPVNLKNVRSLVLINATLVLISILFFKQEYVLFVMLVNLTFIRAGAARCRNVLPKVLTTSPHCYIISEINT